MDNENKVLYLEEKAKTLRKTLLTMIYHAQSGHPGGSLSIADVVTVLYEDEMNIDPKNPELKNRDRLVLSKGHTCPVIYSILALKGYYEYDEIYTLRKLGSNLQGHPHMRYVKGIDMTTGSLGQGLSVGVGMALIQKQKYEGARTFVIIGDGETNEGQIWEAAMTGSKYMLDNLIAIVDYNKLQNDGHTNEIMPNETMAKKWAAFGWEVIEFDGHSMKEILEAFKKAKTVKDKPICLLANTVKGKGVSYMEDVCCWHGLAPNEEEFNQAIKEIEGGI